MENTDPIEQNEIESQKKRGFWGWTIILIRWLFILLFAVILLGGLYFKAPWKVLVLDALLLALLTVVPKKKRKYGWLALAVTVLAVTIWIFIPEKDTGNWRPYTFDEELAALEAERLVSPEMNAAPLYEDLFQRWKQIEENDPFPEEADDECITGSRPWTEKGFPEVAAWYERHEEFFNDLIIATQMPACYFPGSVTSLQLSESMEKLVPVKKFALHLHKLSHLDLGEKDIPSALEKQLAIFDLGRHMNQQPLLIDILVGVAAEAMAYDAAKTSLMQESFTENATLNDIAAIKKKIETSHFDQQEKWKQILAYEKLLAKNTYAMMYEINSEGKIRSSNLKSVMNAIQDLCPDEELAEQLTELSNSYWRGVSFKVSKFFLWLSGQPNDPKVLSEWVDESYGLIEKTIKNDNGFSETDVNHIFPFELNYEYFIKRVSLISLPSFKKVQGDILPKVRTQRLGTNIVFDLALYKKQHGQYPDTLDELWHPEEDRQVALELYGGFVYEKLGDSFKLYHVGQNGIDENGKYVMPPYDPNDSAAGLFGNRKPKPDDILIWPEKLEDRDQYGLCGLKGQCILAQPSGLGSGAPQPFSP